MKITEARRRLLCLLVIGGIMWSTAGCGVKTAVQNEKAASAATADEDAPEPALKPLKGAYLEISLGSPAPHHGLPLHAAHSPSLLDLLRVLQKAQGDKKIKGLVLNTADFAGGREFVWELRSALESFKGAGKRIVAFIDDADLDRYLLASVADVIVMDRTGSLTLTGYVYGRGYLRQTLEKLGIGARELRYLDYKSAAETFTRDSLSEADRLQYNAYLDDVFGLTKATLMRARSWSGEQFDAILNQEFLFSASAAQSRGLADRLGREEALREAIEALEGRRAETILSYGGEGLLAGRRRREYRIPSRFKGRLFAQEIAVIRAEGETSMDRGMGVRELARTIREIAARPAVQAMVIRVDSPGGSAEAADYVAQAIREARELLPVVVSMGSVAASGGYWASMYADHITASPYTLTGSIGVIATWFYEKGVYDTLGVSVDALRRGAHGDLFTGIFLPRRDLTADEEERYRRYILDLYSEFTAKVAEGRKMDAERVESLAQGRVYSGLEAQRLGLTDSVGGLSEALDKARELAEIPAKKRVVYREYPKPDLWDALRDMLPGGLGAAVRGSAYPGLDALSTEAGLPLGLVAALWEQLRYRIACNGRAMPVLPLAEAAGLSW
ncbi:MAG: signal peptide peptidase SppA [Treponema sp.]|jgi:protease-4|nr:signal peptide peptidase SppA [Treponema sp.]